MAITRGGVEDTRLDANAKETKKIRGQGATSRGQTLSRPSTGMLEAKAADLFLSIWGDNLQFYSNFVLSLTLEGMNFDQWG